MVVVRRTRVFDEWLQALRDVRAQARIEKRLDRLAAGNTGESRSVGEGVSELKIDYGPGYRVYFIWQGLELVILLSGGDKSSQRRDIERAKKMARLNKADQPELD